MKRTVFLVAMFFIMLGTSVVSAQTDADNFYRSSSVNRQEVSFDNQYKMKVAGNLFTPKNMKDGEKYREPRNTVSPEIPHRSYPFRQAWIFSSRNILNNERRQI